MKKNSRIQRLANILILCTILSLLFTCSEPTEKYIDPELLFKNPPENAKTGVLWMWMGSNITKQGITADLEALKEEGFNRATVFSLSDITTPASMVIHQSPTPKLIAWTEPWWQMVRYAAEECKRLKIDFGMFNCPGYETSGGPWITPEKSMQELCWSSTNANGTGSSQRLLLPKPIVDSHAQMPYYVYDSGTDTAGKLVVPARQTYYKDIAVVALPSSGNVDEDDIEVLTSNMNASGNLEWKVPQGNWTIYRFGHTTTGALLQPAQPEAIGLECDKMDPEAVNFHLDHVLSQLKSHLGPLFGTAFTHLHFDSYEAGIPGWTPKMSQEFESRRGYTLTKYLPVFAGRIVEDDKKTQHFRNDFWETINDLYRDVYFKTIAAKTKAAGISFTCEPYGGPWKQEEVLPFVPKVMTEFWTDSGRFTPFKMEPTVNELHKTGQNIIEAEAFTGQPADSRWTEYPAWLKLISDAAFCAGVNRLVLHRFVHQPWDNKYKPGNTMGQWGTHFDRTQTWWKPAKAMVQYWQRCQALLQWGHFVEKSEEDFKVDEVTHSLQIEYIHRQQNETEIYFVANTSHHSGTAKCSFDVQDLQPELWDPVTGNIKELATYEVDDDKTSITIPFDDAQSYFIVFRKKAKSPVKTTNFPKLRTVYTCSNSWQVQFDPAWGGPAKSVTFSTLSDWTTHAVNGIKYYSGTAIYTTVIDSFPFAKQTKVLYLNLGKVNHIAKVKLNGKDLGVVWTAPWQVHIPTALLTTTNKLEIEVTNVWANRLIGDEQEPADMEWGSSQYFYNSGQYLKAFPDWFIKDNPRPSKGRYCFTTWNYFDKSSPLIASGLLGPVTIMAEE